MAVRIAGGIFAFFAVGLILNYGIRAVTQRALENSKNSPRNVMPTTRLEFKTWDTSKTLNLNPQYQPKPVAKSAGLIK